MVHSTRHSVALLANAMTPEERAKSELEQARYLASGHMPEYQTEPVVPAPTIKWRLGGKIVLNVYEGNRPVCQCHNEADARRIVAAVNANAAPGPTQEQAARPAWLDSCARGQGLWLSDTRELARYALHLEREQAALKTEISEALLSGERAEERDHEREEALMAHVADLEREQAESAACFGALSREKDLYVERIEALEAALREAYDAACPCHACSIVRTVIRKALGGAR